MTTATINLRQPLHDAGYNHPATTSPVSTKRSTICVCVDDHWFGSWDRPEYKGNGGVLNRKKVLALWCKIFERELDIRLPGKYEIEYRNSDEMPYTQKTNGVFRLINKHWSRWLKTAELATLWKHTGIGFAAIYDADGITIQTPDYCHLFEDGIDAAACIEKFLDNRQTRNWADNEPDRRKTFEKQGEWLLSSEFYELLNVDIAKIDAFRHLGENYQRFMAYFGITVEHAA
ncbi:MAG: hypothetical protein RBT34_04395 [Anaerolineaceae bacterium]|jgi:hypothetical protein|nr:hypothetical protein [Anaerolineaceae bacterium]